MGLPIDLMYIRLFIRLLLGLILLSVSVSKLAHPVRFRRGIQDYQVFPSILGSKIAFPAIASFCIPLAEIAAGLGLISGFLLVSASVLTLVLFVLFSGAIIVNLMRGRYNLSCHCGGTLGDHSISWWLVGRNCLFIVSLLVLLATPSDMFTVDTFVRSPSLLNGGLLSKVFPIALL